MKEILSPSLLPYLQADGNQFRLEISLISREPSFLAKSPYPFLLIDESTPFERLLEARIVSGAGSEIKRLFLLQQSDRYRHTADRMWPLTNPDIDRRWETALNRFSSVRGGRSGVPGPVMLTHPNQESGEYEPFLPLFYCSFENVYFHPPCPECGNLLDLCRNDRLLSDSGLAAYSTSLRRYLHCPECSRDSGSAPFYTYARHGDDPPGLKDRWDLINDFGELVLKSGSSDRFPCMGCPEVAACYGSDGQVMSRIVPFSFYPFHMLIFEADTFSAPDFLALISGASVEAINTNSTERKTGGRQHCLQQYEQLPESISGVFFSNDDKRFLEILYLKLSFLAELIGLLYGESNHKVYCDSALSLDRIWVRLADQAMRLPQFWNFRLSVIDLWSDTIQQPHLSQYPPAYGHQFLGNVWFYALLVNERQSMEVVRAELDARLSALSALDEMPAEIKPIDAAETAFAPENIFWNPESKPVAADWQDYWKRALALGGDLLAAGLQAGRVGLPDEFWRQLDGLRSEVKAALFEAQTDSADSSAGNEEIAAILNRLGNRWRQEVTPMAAPASGEDADTIILDGAPHSEDLTNTLILTSPAPQDEPPKGDGQTDEEETLILSPDSPIQPAKPEIDPSPVDDDPLKKTVILAAKNRVKQPGAAGDAMNEEPLQETVILSPKSGANSAGREARPSDEELIQETVILSPGGAGPQPDHARHPVSDPGEPDLAETVVLPPGGQRPGPPNSTGSKDRHGNQDSDSPRPDQKDIRLKIRSPKGPGASPDDDILTETVILRPPKKKGT